MRRNYFRTLVLLGGYGIAALLGAVLASPGSALAVNGNYVYDFPADKAQDINDAVKKDPPNANDTALDDTYVIGRDPVWPDSGFRKYSYSPDQAKDDLEKHYLDYRTVYYCAGGKVVADKPDSGKYSVIQLDVLAHIDDGFYKNVTHKAKTGVSRYTEFSDGEQTKDWKADDIYSGGHLKDLPPDCFPSGIISDSAGSFFDIRNLHDPATPIAVWGVAELSVADQKDADPVDDSGGDKDKCDGGSFGWAICPILDNIQKGVEGIETGLINPFLETQPLTTKSTEYKVWDAVRNLANVIFVLVFFAIVFGNLLSISSYSVKKMLPRLIAAAVLVQLSYLAVSLAVDITNVLGAGLFQLIDSTIPGYSGSPGVGSGLALGAVFGGLLAAATAAALSGTILIIAGVAFFGVLGVFFTLIFRQVLIVVLIITAPLAFAAWVLPGTENYFNKWKDNLIKVLMMYPLIVLLFASSKLVGAAVTGADIPGAFKTIAAIMGAVAPLFLVPMTFKSGGQLFSAGAGRIKDLQKGRQKSLKDSDFAKNLQANHDARKLEKLSANIDKGGLRGWYAGAKKGAVFGRNSASGLAQINATQQSVMNAAKDRIKAGNYSSNDLANAVKGDWDKVSAGAKTALQGAMRSPAGVAAVHALAAEGGRWNADSAANLVQNSGLNRQQAQRALDFIRSGDSGKKVREQNRVLATANIEAFGTQGMNFDASQVDADTRKSIRIQSQGLSAQELSKHSSDEAMEMLASMGADGIGQVRGSTIASLKDQRIANTMTDKQRKAVFDNVNASGAAVQQEFNQRIAAQQAEVNAQVPNTQAHTEAVNKLNDIIAEQQKAADAVVKTNATINPDGTPT